MRKALYIMGILDDSDVEWLSRNGTRKFIPAGAVIVHQGEAVDSLFIVLDGQLLVYSGSLEIAKLQCGEVVGEISFVDSRPPLASVRAAHDTQVLSINAELLKAKLEKDVGFASRFYRALATFLADRLRVTTSRFGYGSHDQDLGEQGDPDELHLDLMDSIALASTRFDKMLKRLAEGSGT